MPCRSIFSTSMATKISRKSRSKPTNGSSSNGKVAAAQLQAQKCYPFRHAAGQFGRIFVQSPAVRPTFAASAMISPSSGLSIKIADILHRGQVSRQAVFLKQKTRFAESIAYRARFRRFPTRNQPQNRRLAAAARPEQSFYFAVLQVQT